MQITPVRIIPDEQKESESFVYMGYSRKISCVNYATNEELVDRHQLAGSENTRSEMDVKRLLIIFV